MLHCLPLFWNFFFRLILARKLDWGTVWTEVWGHGFSAAGVRWTLGWAVSVLHWECGVRGFPREESTEPLNSDTYVECHFPYLKLKTRLFDFLLISTSITILFCGALPFHQNNNCQGVSEGSFPNEEVVKLVASMFLGVTDLTGFVFTSWSSWWFMAICTIKKIGISWDFMGLNSDYHDYKTARWCFFFFLIFRLFYMSRNMCGDVSGAGSETARTLARQWLLCATRPCRPMPGWGDAEDTEDTVGFDLTKMGGW